MTDDARKASRGQSKAKITVNGSEERRYREARLHGQF